jgi:hypothetical protein
MTYALAASGVVDPEEHVADPESIVREALSSRFKTPPYRIRTGAAKGIDTLVARVAYELWPKAIHEIVVPAAPHNEEIVKFGEERHFAVIKMPPEKDDTTAYMKRNDYLVKGMDWLIAFPATSTPKRRSGTWSTVRRAEKRGLGLTLVPLEEVDDRWMTESTGS